MEILYCIIILLLLLAFAIVIYFLSQHYKRQLKKEIRRAQKSEQLKSVFIENVSHTLRTPLNAIVGYSNMILEENDATMQPAQVKEMASHIHTDSQDLLNFVGQLFEMREALNITKPDVSVRVRTDLSPHCKAFLDTNLMHQLMMHLLTNAAKYCTQGDIIINYGNERKGIKVSISYSGNGKAELIGADIYSFLQQKDALKHVNESSVFGISLCKAIVDVLGGEFYMDTEYGSKTIASFWFPCKMRDKRKDM